jgi:broad specificity phosphatase PhoE
VPVRYHPACVRRLYLMRHGETLYLGRQSVDGTDLTAEGRRQAERAGELFARVPLDLVVASPMRRAMGTAGIIAARKNLGVEPANDLREIMPGALDGLAPAEVFSRVLEFFSSPDVTWDTPFVGGETFRQLHARVMRFLGSLLARAGWTNTLAVAHGGANMAFFAGVLGMSEGEIPRLEQDLGCINIIDFAGNGRGLTRLINFSVHDPLKDGLREPSFARLEDVIAARGRELQGGRGSFGRIPRA